MNIFLKTLRTILIFSFLTLWTSLSAQNEAFHGGSGDGAATVNASFNFDNVPYVGNDLNVTVNQAAGQADPTNTGPVYFTVVFSEAVTDFDASDVDFIGLVTPQTVNVTGSGTTYTIELNNFDSNGGIVVQIPAGAAHNSVGNPNKVSSSADDTVIFTGINLNVEINLETGQPAVSNATTVHFQVQFSDPVIDFSSADVSLSGTANASNIVVTGSGSLYDVAVSGMTNDGTVTINIPANLVHNLYGTSNQTSINTENTITCDYTKPNIGINLAPGQVTPSPATVLQFLVSVSEPIDALEASDIQLSGTAGASGLSINQNGNDYTVLVTGMTQEGTVIINIAANSVFDLAGNGNNASTNVQNEIYYTNLSFMVEITQAATQQDPTSSDLAEFNIHFNREPTDFDVSDITISGNLPSNPVGLNGSGTDYTLSLSGFANDGTVSINIPVNKIHDAFNSGNEASINTDNTITIDKHTPTVEIKLGNSQNNPSNKTTLLFNAIFSENVIGFTSEDIQLSGSAGANIIDLSGSGTNYQIAVSGMNADGNVTITIPANKCTDLAGNQNSASVNTQNEISYDITKPSVEIKHADGQSDPSLTLPLNFSITFSEEVAEFTSSGINYGGSAGVYLTVTGSGKDYNVAVNGVQTNETIAITIPANMVHDLAGNLNTASINTENSITYTGTTGFVDANGLSGCKISYSDGMVQVNFDQTPQNNTVMYIYSINGKLIYSKEHLDKQNSFYLNLNTLFIVRVVENNKQTSNLLSPN